VRVMLSNKHVEAVEEDDHDEVDQGEPGSVWLEMTLEDKSVAVNPLGFEGLVELEIGNADRAPGEEGGNGSQVLEPCENNRWATRADGKEGKEGDRGGDQDTPVWDTGLAAAEKEAWSLFILGKSKEITGSGVQEGVGG
jgi:hypothetical protein